MSPLAYVHNNFIPSRAANTIHVMKMSQAFAQEGYQPTLFACRSAGNPVAWETLQRHYGLTEPFPVELIPAYRIFRWHDFAWRAARRIKQYGFSMVYSRALVAALWTAQQGIPTIYETHQPPGHRLGQYYLRMLLARRSFVRMVVISDPIKQMHLAHYPRLLKPEQIIIEPDAVDLERFENLPDVYPARQILSLPTAPFTIGYAGSLLSGRGVELILELARRLPEIHFLIMGGDEADIHYWRNMETSENITLTGFIPNAELPRYLAACDVLLMPYQQRVAVHGTNISTHAWMSPMKMFEYMASERLIISSDLPILRTVLNEHNAVLCQPDSADEWEQAIRRTINEPTWAHQLAAQARRDVESYTWRKRVQRIMEHLV